MTNLVIVSDGQSVIVGYHVVMDGQNCLGVGLDPGDLESNSIRIYSSAQPGY